MGAINQMLYCIHRNKLEYHFEKMIFLMVMKYADGDPTGGADFMLSDKEDDLVRITSKLFGWIRRKISSNDMNMLHAVHRELKIKGEDNGK